MPSLALVDTVGNPKVDLLLRDLVGAFEEAFPGRVRSYYLVGSQADGSAVDLSDVDIRAVFKGKFEEEELQRFLSLRAHLRQVNVLEIDCPPLDEHRLQHEPDWLHETLSIKYAARLLFGQDIRSELPDPPLEAYLGNTAQALRRFVSRLHRQESVTFPLSYPDPLGEFYGYEMPASPESEPSLKMLVHVAGFLGTWKIAQETGQMVVKKSDWLPKYQVLIHDAWTPLLEELWKRCKLGWAYRLPDVPADHAWLRQACEQFLRFENETLVNHTDPRGLLPWA